MRFLQKVKDGGPKSNVDAYVLIEIKSLFSIMLLKFNEGSRDEYHTHAFNAVTIPLSGSLVQLELTRHSRPNMYEYRNFSIKKTPRTLFHKVVAMKDSWALTFRGPWEPFWKEYNPKTGTTTEFTHGRKVLATWSGKYL